MFSILLNNILWNAFKLINMIGNQKLSSEKNSQPVFVIFLSLEYLDTSVRNQIFLSQQLNKT